MTVYITIQDVDELLGDTWAAADKKGKAVLQANTWMTALNLQDIDPEHIPEEVKQAGAFIASVAAAGNLYQQKTDSGVVTSKSVEADDVKVSRTFAELSTTSTELLDPDLQLALDMLKPWMINPFQTFFVALAIGSLLWWPNRRQKGELKSREGFLIVVLFWTVLGSVGSLPFIFSEQPNLSITDAFFESFSGLKIGRAHV